MQQKIVIHNEGIRQAYKALQSEVCWHPNIDRVKVDREICNVLSIVLGFFLEADCNNAEEEDITSLRFPEFFEEIAFDIEQSYLWQTFFKDTGHYIHDFEVISSYGDAILTLKPL